MNVFTRLSGELIMIVTRIDAPNSIHVLENGYLTINNRKGNGSANIAIILITGTYKNVKSKTAYTANKTAPSVISLVRFIFYLLFLKRKA